MIKKGVIRFLFFAGIAALITQVFSAWSGQREETFIGLQ